MRFNIPIRSNKNKPDSLGSKIGASLFLSIFGLMGTFFMIMMIRALFKKEAEWYLIFFLIIPLIFMVIGFGGIYGVWFGKEKPKGAKAKSAKMGKMPGVLFGLIFVVVGLGFSYWLLIRPLIKTYQAKGWTETPSKIISAKVGSHSDDDGTTYSVDITYEYVFSGQTYRADRYDFIGGSSSGYKRKKEVVDRYKTMSNPVCYVDPEKPSEAILQRELTLKNAIGLFPLLFVGAGFLVMFGTIKSKRHKKIEWLPKMKSSDETTGNAYAFTSQTDDTSEETVVLKPDASPFGKLIGILIFCLFWNGIVSVFIYHVVEGFQGHDPDWFLTLFMIPFVLVGLGTIGAVFYQILALFNPRYTLMLMPGQLYPGSTGVIGWQASGQVQRVRSLAIKLLGEEEARYQVGTNTRTAKNTFFEMELFTTEEYQDVAAGEIGFVIPAETMHSFEASNNKIIWSINVHGDIARWPDVKHQYKITISPKPIE